MKVYIENLQQQPVTEENDALIYKVISACLEYEQFEDSVEVSVTLVDNEKIREINNEFRNIDKETDVLSFPILEFEQGYLQLNNGECRKKIDVKFKEDFDYNENHELLLGDIIVSIDKALEQAEEYGHSFERELAFLICHSMFHLMGYDHMDKEDEKIMQYKQETVLEKLGYTR